MRQWAIVEAILMIGRAIPALSPFTNAIASAVARIGGGGGCRGLIP